MQDSVTIIFVVTTVIRARGQNKITQATPAREGNTMTWDSWPCYKISSHPLLYFLF